MYAVKTPCTPDWDRMQRTKIKAGQRCRQGGIATDACSSSTDVTVSVDYITVTSLMDAEIPPVWRVGHMRKLSAVAATGPDRAAPWRSLSRQSESAKMGRICLSLNACRSNSPGRRLCIWRRSVISGITKDYVADAAVLS